MVVAVVVVVVVNNLLVSGPAECRAAQLTRESTSRPLCPRANISV